MFLNVGIGLDWEQSLFSLLSSSSRGMISRTPGRGNLDKEEQEQFPRAGVRDVFPRLDELKRKNRDCSQSSIGFTFVIFRSHKPTGSINTLCQLAATLADKNWAIK